MLGWKKEERRGVQGVLTLVEYGGLLGAGYSLARWYYGDVANAVVPAEKAAPIFVAAGVGIVVLTEVRKYVLQQVERGMKKHSGLEEKIK